MAPQIIHRKRIHKSDRAWEPSERDLNIYVEYTRGKSQRRIGEKYKLTRPAISVICAKLDKWFADQYMGKIRELKANHTQRLEHIYRQAIAAWERSKGDAETITEIDIAGANGGSQSGTKKTRKGQVGGVQYLNAAMAAAEQIRNIWGANAPLEIKHTGEVRVAGRPIEEARSELLERMQRLTEASATKMHAESFAHGIAVGISCCVPLICLLVCFVRARRK